MEKKTYPWILLEAIIFLLYSIFGKRRDYTEATLLRSPKETPDYWNINYSDVTENKSNHKQIRKITSGFESVIHFAKRLENPRILEVGFGNGGDLIALDNELSEVSLYGVEPSLTAIKNLDKYSKLINCNLNLFNGEIYTLPFQDGVFDIVYISQVFEHLTEPSLALQELIRITKNEGHFIIGVPQLYHTKTIIKHAVMRVRANQNDFEVIDETEYSAKELSNLLSFYNLEIKEIVGRGSLFDEYIWKQILRFFPRTSQFLKRCLHKYFSVSIIITGKKIMGRHMQQLSSNGLIMDRKTYSRDIYSKFWITAREEHSFSKGLLKYETNLCNYICKNVHPGKKLLDAAIGTGSPFGDFFQKAGFSVHGIDIAAILVQKCQQLYPNIKCKVGDVEDLDYPDEYFDCTYCFNSTFYLPDLNKAINEMLRVTCQGGILIFDIKNRDNEVVDSTYRNCLAQNIGVGRIIRYAKNIAKIFLRKGIPNWDWNAVVHEVPTYPASIYDHFKENNISNFSVMVKKANGSIEEINEFSSFKNFARLVFIVRK